MKANEKEMIQWFHLGFRHSMLGESIPPDKKSKEYIPSYLAGQKYHQEEGGPKCFLKDEYILNLCNSYNHGTNT